MQQSVVKHFPLSVLTCSHHFVDGDAGGVQLLCKLVHSLARVLIGVGVHVGPDTRQTHYSRKEQIVSANDRLQKYVPPCVCPVPRPNVL